MYVQEFNGNLGGADAGECPSWPVRSSALFSSGESASVASNPTALRNSCFNHRGSRRAQFQQKIPRNFRSLRVTGRVPQRLKPGVENQSEWLASYAEVFAPTRHRLRSRPWVMRTVCFPPSPHTPPQIARALD